jgi:hypothetical protein
MIGSWIGSTGAFPVAGLDGPMLTVLAESEQTVGDVNVMDRPEKEYHQAPGDGFE